MKPLEIVIFILLIGSLGFTFFNGGQCVLCSLFNKNTSETINDNKQLISYNPSLDLNESNFDKEVLQSNIPVVVDFYAHWCGPCKKLSPIIDELSTEYSGKIKFTKLDVDKNENLTSSYNINSIPHLIIFIDGKPVDHILGLHSKTEIEEILNNLVK